MAECFFKTEEQDRIVLLPTEHELFEKKERNHVFLLCFYFLFQWLVHCLLVSHLLSDILSVCCFLRNGFLLAN